MDFRSIIAVFGSIMVVGCATIVAGPTDDISISSEPSGASIAIVDEEQAQVYSGVTPATVTLDKGAGFFQGKTYEVTIAKDGYAPQTVALETSLSGWYLAGNIVFGGLIGWLILDPATGAMWTIDPEKVEATLATQTSDNGSRTLVVTLLEDLPDNLRDKMVRLY